MSLGLCGVRFGGGVSLSSWMRWLDLRWPQGGFSREQRSAGHSLGEFQSKGFWEAGGMWCYTHEDRG